MRVVRELEKRQDAPVGQREVGGVLDGVYRADRTGDEQTRVKLELERDGLRDAWRHKV